MVAKEIGGSRDQKTPVAEIAANKEVIPYSQLKIGEEAEVHPRVTPVAGSFIQRSLSVSNTPPRNMPSNDVAASIPFAAKVAQFRSIIQSLCPSFTIDSTGVVVPSSTPAPTPADLDSGPNPVACCGLSILVNGSHNWELRMSQLLGPHTEPDVFVVVLPPIDSTITFGHFTGSGGRANMPLSVTAGHEIIGHAAETELDVHNEGDEDRESFDHHDPTVRIQNAVGHEQGEPASRDRGLTADGVHRGESFAKVVVSQFPFDGFETSQLPPSEQDKLRLAADFITTNRLVADITGHSDPVGSEAAKQNISNLRANAVRNRLNAFGVSNHLVREFPTYIYNGPRFTSVRGRSDLEPPFMGTADHANWRRAEIFMASHPAGAQNPPSNLPELRPATPGAGLPAARTSSNPCHRRLAAIAFP